MSEEQKATYDLQAMVMRGAKISWEVPHARKRALCRDILPLEAERIVQAGNVARIDTMDDGEIRWRVSGHDSDNRPVDVVVSPRRNSVLMVITVIRTDE